MILSHNEGGRQYSPQEERELKAGEGILFLFNTIKQLCSTIEKTHPGKDYG